MDIKTLPISSVTAHEALKNIKVIYTDLDGTLLAPGGRALVDNDGTPSIMLAQALVSLTLAGITVIPVTGRNQIQLVELCRILNFEGFIGEMGAVVGHGQGSKVSLSYELGEWGTFDGPQEPTPYQQIEDSGAVEALLSARTDGLEYHTPWNRNRDVTHLLRGYIDPQQAERILARFDLPLTLRDNGVIHPPKHKLSLGDDEDIHGYHLLPTGVSKAGAVKRDIVSRGLTLDQTVFIGDSIEDLMAGSETGAAVMVQKSLSDTAVQEALTDASLLNGRPVFSTPTWPAFADEVLKATTR